MCCDGLYEKRPVLGSESTYFDVRKSESPFSAPLPSLSCVCALTDAANELDGYSNDERLIDANLTVLISIVDARIFLRISLSVIFCLQRGHSGL
jgi:hypothetical protein